MTPNHPVRAIGALVSSAALALVGLAAAPAAHAIDTASPIVISEVYGGGGNTGATLTHDFIELHNNGSTTIDISGWSVQYASASGTTWSVTQLTGSIAPGGYYLIAEGKGTGGTTGLPTADATGNINLSGTSGKVALVNSATPLAGCAAACSSAAGVLDFVGFGAANDAAGGVPTTATTNATSAQRTPVTKNTGVNGSDFTIAEPTPKAAPAGSTPTDPPTEPPAPGPLTIQDIQGPGFISPVKGQAVTNVPGVVTAIRSTGSTRGYWIQQPTKDAAKAPASSGVFVFTGSAAITVKVGDAVLVSGSVSDYYPLQSGETLATTDSLSMTEITRPSAVVLSSGNPLPASVTLPADLPSTYAPTVTGGNVESLNPLDPSRSAMEWYESHEGELVTVDDARVVGPGKAQYGEIYVTSKPAEFPTARGGTYLSSYAALPTGRILVSPVNGQVPPANVGDVLAGATTGPIDWSLYGGYDIAATALGSRVDNGLTKTVVDPATADELTVATYNVENLAPSDAATKYAALAEGIVTNLRSPDIITVEEIQDNSGATDNGVVASDVTVAKLVAAIAAAGGPTYQAAWIDPQDKVDGGQPGGNIRVGFLYNPDRVTFVAKPGGDATTAVTVAKDTTPGLVDTPTLSVSPGRVDPTNAAWTSSRKPLAGEFVFAGRKVIVVANHFNSKGGDESAEGRFQPPNRSSEVQRTAQAQSLRSFVEQVMSVDPQANVVLAGDFNDYQFSAPMTTLTDNGALLTDLINTLPAAACYTYVFNGVSQVLDHIMVSRPISDAGAVRYQIAHLNSEFAVQTSDHDPQVARIKPVVHLYAAGSVSLVADQRKPGQLVELNLSGWTPGDVVTVTYDGSVLGRVTIGADGTGYFAYRLAEKTAPGRYTLSLAGKQTFPTTIPVTVVAKTGPYKP